MKAVLIALGLVIGGLALAAGSLFMMYVSVHDSAVEWETRLDKFNKDSENILSTTTLTIQETAGITGKYSADIKDVIKGTYEGRYGPNGSQAAMQWIQEQNVQLDTKLYMKVQDVIEGGRKEFKISQTRKLEVCEPYKNMVGSAVRGTILKFIGFPKINLEETCRIVSDAASREAFQTGEQKAIQFK